MVTTSGKMVNTSDFAIGLPELLGSNAFKVFKELGEVGWIVVKLTRNGSNRQRSG